MIADSQITFLPVADLGRSRVFYEGILGLQIIVDQGTCHIFKASCAGFVGTCLNENAQAADGVIVTLVSDDVDGWCDRIVAGGHAIDRGPEHNDRFGIYHAFLRDPDGHLIEIQRFDDPDWSTASQ
jgi:catechol 2,3-dioxygenase-like lactoylglutathione lyase family enzyme